MHMVIHHHMYAHVQFPEVNDGLQKHYLNFQFFSSIQLVLCDLHCSHGHEKSKLYVGKKIRSGAVRCLLKMALD